ncbi:response regulator [Stenotrophomonas sp. G106K1]|uniref:response regulator n=1 Tax=Stenotrophomonas sp. G106K1 TaxID=3134792 RepID=UPI0030F3EF16
MVNVTSSTAVGGRTVVVADEHSIYVLGVVSTLRSIPSVAISGLTTQPHTLLELVAQHRPDIVITGYNLQSEEGTTANCAPIAEIGQLSPRTRIIVITPQASEGLRRSILVAGAHLVESKACTTSTLHRQPQRPCRQRS